MKTKDIIAQTLSKKIGKIILFIATTIVAAVLQVFLIIIVGHLVDKVFPTPIVNNPRLALWITLFTLSLLAMIGLKLFNRSLAQEISENVSGELTNQLVSASLRSEISEFEKINEGEIYNAITEDTKKISEEYLGKNWQYFIRNSIYIIAFFITSMILNSWLGLITFGLLIVFYTAIKSFEKFYNVLSVKIKVNSRKRNKHIKASLSDVENIKLKNSIAYEEEAIKNLNEKYIKDQKIQSVLLEVKERQGFELLVGLLLTLLLGVGGYISTRTTAIPGTIVAITLMAVITYSLFNQLMSINILPKFINNEVARLDSILTIRSEFRAEPVNELNEVKVLEFERVSYTLDNIKIKGLNFELQLNDKLAVLAVDGSDKAIFSLLTKLARPNFGQVLVNGVDYNKINTEYLRSLISTVVPTRVLQDASIMENIIYPLEFDEYRYNSALNKSGLKHLIANFPDKDNTILSKNHPLYEEMRYRIAYANLFYKDSRIIIIDEQDNFSDARVEEQIFREIINLKNKITIVFTNKNYNILKCDKVLIVNETGILEYGKVEELLNNSNSIMSKIIKKAKITKSANIS